MSTKTIFESFLHACCCEVSPSDFYRDIFPQGALADKELKEKQKYAGLIYPRGGLSRYVNDDLQTVLECAQSTFATMNCISYAGSGNTPELARELYALALRLSVPEDIAPSDFHSWLVDLDLQRDSRYTQMNLGASRMYPTYIVTNARCHEIYFYYLLYEPLPLYHSLHKQIQRLYEALSRAIHSSFDRYHYDKIEKKRVYTYECRKPRPESFFAKFPVVGSRSKNSVYKAYKFGGRYDIEALNAIVPKACTVNIFHPTMTLEEAKEQYSKWYERRIERGQKATGQRTGKLNKKLYAWFLRLVDDNIEIVEPGVLEAIASYACKTHIWEEDFLSDLEDYAKKLESRFSHDVIEEHKARATYFFNEYPTLLKKWGVDGINKWSGLSIEKDPRTDFNRKEHLNLLSESKSRQKDVQEWQKEHPTEKQADCARALGISRKTVSKWWVQPPKVKNPCPLCGSEMEKIKVEPWYWEKKGKYCTRTYKKCPHCHYEVKGKVRYL